MVTDDSFEAVSKTKQLAGLLARQDQARKRFLVIVEKMSEGLARASRNISRTAFRATSIVNARDVLTAQGVICTEKALEKLSKERFHAA